MKAPEEKGQTATAGEAAWELDPDIRALGEYLAEKQGVTFVEFVEYLVTKEASKQMVSCDD